MVFFSSIYFEIVILSFYRKQRNEIIPQNSADEKSCSYQIMETNISGSVNVCQGFVSAPFLNYYFHFQNFINNNNNLLMILVYIKQSIENLTKLEIIIIIEQHSIDYL